MKLIVGLGNPGDKYARNRHNVGFMAVDHVHEFHNFGPWRKRFSGLVAEGRLGRDKCLLLKPETWMNESGRAVGEALRFYKLEADDVIVLHDEIDLPPGRLKAKCGGGNAGHNGLRSLSAHIGNDYHRIRIGVGRPAQKSQVSGYVLRDFAKADAQWLEPLLEAIARKMDVFTQKGAPDFLKEMQDYLEPPGKSGQKSERGDQAPGEKPTAPERKAATKKKDNRGALADLLKNWKKDNGDED